MGLIAQWNKTDLSQLASGGAVDFTDNGGTPTLSVVNIGERGNVLRYLPGGAVGLGGHIFMFSEASGLLIPSADERRDVDVEIEIYTATFGSTSGMGIFFCGDADAVQHGFAHMGVGSGTQERSFTLNNGTLQPSATTGTAAARFNTYRLRGRKPAGAPPEMASHFDGWGVSVGVAGTIRRTGTTTTATGGVTLMGTASALGATWNDISANRIGLAFRGNPMPTSIDIMDVRIIDPFSSGGGGGTPPDVTFVDPAPGTPISATQAITVDVSDPDGDSDLLLVCLSASLSEGLDEVIYRNGAFTVGYAASTVTPITDGFRFVIRRIAGWRSEVTINADVADAGGNLV